LLRATLAMFLILLAIAAGWTCWAIAAWVRYDHVPRTTERDALIASLMPRCEVAERHERIVAANAGVTFRSARAFRLEDSPVIRAIIGSREGLLSAPRSRQPALPLVELAPRIGWAVLDSIRGRELAFGAVAQPWQGEVRFHPLPRARFKAFRNPGFAKIAWTIAVDSLGPMRTRLRTETRVLTTDPSSRALFRRYWAVFSPGIVLIRYEALRMIGSDAEHREKARRDALLRGRAGRR
jgi:hypothetical protein